MFTLLVAVVGSRLRVQRMPVAAPRGARTFGKQSMTKDRARPRSATRVSESAKADLEPGRVCHIPEQGWASEFRFLRMCSGETGPRLPGGAPPGPLMADTLLSSIFVTKSR